MPTIAQTERDCPEGIASCAKQPPRQDFAAELYACTDLMDLCLFRDKMHTLLVESQNSGATVTDGIAAYYLRQAKAQISHLTSKGVFLARIESEEAVWKSRWRKAQGKVLELKEQAYELRDTLAQTKHEAFSALSLIAEMEPETHDIEEAITIAKERIEYFAPSPTNHTNQ